MCFGFLCFLLFLFMISKESVHTKLVRFTLVVGNLNLSKLNKELLWSFPLERDFTWNAMSLKSETKYSIYVNGWKSKIVSG